MLELKNIKKNKEYIKKARSLYNSAFPSAERIPFDILLYKAKGSNVTFFAVVDKAEFKGLTYTVWNNDIVFIFYLAVEKQARGNGIGSQIL
ncbi:MAG: GNAT family N-acetyltransferase, partial [Clostridiales bacterium]